MVPGSLGCGVAVLAAMAMLAPSRAARNAMASPMAEMTHEDHDASRENKNCDCRPPKKHLPSLVRSRNCRSLSKMPSPIFLRTHCRFREVVCRPRLSRILCTFLQHPAIFECRRTMAVTRARKRHDQIEDGPGRGLMNMNDIVARILLLFAYGSIVAGTMGWFGNAHLVVR
jgi:hypothetical protein